MSLSQCTKCGAKATKETIFHGCKCGNKLFRFVNQKTTPIKESKDLIENKSEEISTIQVTNNGTILIDIKAISAYTSGEKPVIFGKEGKYNIKL